MAADTSMVQGSREGTRTPHRSSQAGETVGANGVLGSCRYTSPVANAATLGVHVSEPITCLIVDDHEVVREGLRLSLSRSENIRVVGEAADGQAAVTLAKRRKPNVVIL